MNNQIIIALKKKLEEISAYGGATAETQRNAIKEELQFYVLNFIYHHPKYSDWIMYGGSALRICHELNRMSVDLDFEVDHAITNDFLDKLKEEIVAHFKNVYNIDTDFLTIGVTNNRGLTLKFHIGEELGLDFSSKQVHIKIDLNHFVPPKTVVTENIPKNKDQFSFAIKTYNLSALMASKIAAIFLRGQRGVDKSIYEEKGRDIYDLLWYMSKKIIPDLDYLAAKDIKFADPKELFNKITIKILNNEKTDDNLKQDLTPLFIDQTFINNWLANWRTSYLRSLEEYKIYTVTTLEKINVYQDFHTDIFSFMYQYNTTENKQVKIILRISDYWIDFGEGNLLIETSEKIKKLFKFNSNGWTSNPPSQEKLMQYAELFYKKIEEYFKKTNHIMLGEIITTKVIRMTADNLNQKEQILLNKAALLSCGLDDLLK
ncbi:nucleotidyl transferase AbiEii/AbiGii toxin family protein [Patescibacteria group bacterium]|nr:nucleotidyl transferase AbiEii/AbiGii toxin family protein [Patescibacteria group bacterium]